MSALLLAPLLAALAPAAAPAAAAKLDCPAGAPVRRIARKADLPKGAARAIGFRIAEAGTRFNSGDVVTPETRGLPFARFIAARRCGGLIAVDYEQGGFAYFRTTAWLRKGKAGWVRAER